MYYRLKIGTFLGRGIDSLTYHNGMAFTTKDRDNDNLSSDNCAKRYYGAWWHRNGRHICYDTNLNGKNFDHAKHDPRSINSYTFGGANESLKSTKMAIRPQK